MSSRSEKLREPPSHPLVFAASGGMGKAATIFYKCLAGLLSQKRDQPYSTTVGWLSTALRFTLLQSAVLCLRGSRVRRSPPVSSDHALDRMVSERPSWLLTLHAFLHPLLLDTFIHNLPILYFSFCCISLLYSIVGYCNWHWIILIA